MSLRGSLGRLAEAPILISLPRSLQLFDTDWVEIMPWQSIGIPVPMPINTTYHRCPATPQSRSSMRGYVKIGQANAGTVAAITQRPMDRAFLVYRDLTCFEFKVNGITLI
jgi:hypothetical protein